MRLPLIALIFALLMSACTGAWQDYPVGNQGGKPALNSVVKVGDNLAITVIGEDDLTGDYIVSNAGTIVMPMVGDVMVQGLDADTAATTIKTAFVSGGYFVAPEVGVSMTENRTFAIMGEVLHAGEYPYKDGMSVLDAVAKSGGFSYRANQVDFDIVRKLPDGSENVMQALLSTRIAPNDILRVQERFF